MSSKRGALTSVTVIARESAEVKVGTKGFVFGSVGSRTAEMPWHGRSWSGRRAAPPCSCGLDVGCVCAAVPRWLVPELTVVERVTVVVFALDDLRCAGVGEHSVICLETNRDDIEESGGCGCAFGRWISTPPASLKRR